MSKLVEVQCSNCNKLFLKEASRVKESLKLGYGNACSVRCRTESATKARSKAISTTVDVVLSRIDKTPGQGPNGDCWIWTGYVNPVCGYGYISWNAYSNSRSPIRAHRLVYEILVEKLTPGLVLLHSCDNRLCVNPAHLSPGTQLENDADKVSKNRQARGTSLSHFPHLTEGMVKEIKLEFKAGAMPAPVAKKYKISRSAAKAIKYGISWKHVSID